MIPYYFQEDAINSLLNYFSSGRRGNPIVAMPPSTGKSLVIAFFIYRVLMAWPHVRFLVLTHVKELIQQNSAELLKVWPTAPMGIYSAGLKQRDTILPIIFGGIASVNKNVGIFGFRDVVMIDECDLVSPNDASMYQVALAQLKLVNPNLVVIGLSATPWRLKQGLLTDNGLFTDICYDNTDYQSYNRLVAEGYICPLIPKRTNTVIDIGNVGISKGDYNKHELEVAVDKEDITFGAVKEMVELGYDRNCFLVFAAGINNSEHIASMLQSFGVSACAVHSKLPIAENDMRIKAFKNNEFRALVNNNKLTAGFNHPPIDLIGMLRPTISARLWVQMAGRGGRMSPATGKINCKLLDFAGNTKRLGPVNDPRIPGRPGKGTGDVPVRLCDACGAYNHASARFCCDCGMEFKFETKLFRNASEEEVLRTDAPVIETFEVKKVLYHLHEKRNAAGILTSPPSMRISYFCIMQMFQEWVCLEHPGLIGKRARDWWRLRHKEEPPATTFEALKRCSELREPSHIRVHINKKYPEIKNVEFR